MAYSKKLIYLIFSFLILSVIVSGCSKQQETKVYLAPQTELKLSEIMNYDSVNQFVYTQTTDLENELLSSKLSYEVKRDTFHNVPVYILTSDSGVVKESTYYTYDLSCVKIQLIDQEKVSELSCPKKSGNENPTLTFLKFEKITTPLGEFESKVYGYNSDLYWITDSVPVPIKMSKFNGALVLTLESFN